MKKYYMSLKDVKVEISFKKFLQIKTLQEFLKRQQDGENITLKEVELKIKKEYEKTQN